MASKEKEIKKNGEYSYYVPKSSKFYKLFKSGSYNECIEYVEKNNFTKNQDILNKTTFEIEDTALETSLLTIACMFNTVGVIEHLLKIKNIDVNGEKANNIMGTPLFWAVFHSNVKIIKKLLNFKDIDPNIGFGDEHNIAPIHIALDLKGFIKEIKEETCIDSIINTHWLVSYNKDSRYEIMELLMNHPKIDMYNEGYIYHCGPLYEVLPYKFVCEKIERWQKIKKLFIDKNVDENHKYDLEYSDSDSEDNNDDDNDNS